MILRAPTSPKQRSCERTSARRSQSIAVDRVKPLSRWTFEKSGLASGGLSSAKWLRISIAGKSKANCPRSLHVAAAQAGVLGLGYPEEFGGFSDGFDTSSTASRKLRNSAGWAREASVRRS